MSLITRIWRPNKASVGAILAYICSSLPRAAPSEKGFQRGSPKQPPTGKSMDPGQRRRKLTPILSLLGKARAREWARAEGHGAMPSAGGQFAGGTWAGHFEPILALRRLRLAAARGPLGYFPTSGLHVHTAGKKTPLPGRRQEKKP